MRNTELGATPKYPTQFPPAGRGRDGGAWAEAIGAAVQLLEAPLGSSWPDAPTRHQLQHVYLALADAHSDLTRDDATLALDPETVDLTESPCGALQLAASHLQACLATLPVGAADAAAPAPRVTIAVSLAVRDLGAVHEELHQRAACPGGVPLPARQALAAPEARRDGSW
ncbi:MAG: hypothetical protein ACFCVG_00830 [Kineosporiaceae bacterium]